MIAGWIDGPIVTAPTVRVRPSPLPVGVHDELVELALESMTPVAASWGRKEQSATTEREMHARATLLLKLVWELDRSGRTKEAFSVFRSVASPVEAIRATSGMAVFAAEALLPFVGLAHRAGDSALAERLLSSAKSLLREERGAIADALGPAQSAARVAEAVGDDETAQWLASLSGNAGITLGLERLGALRRAEDPQWEALFDQLEEQLDTIEDPRVHRYAAKALLRCDLARAAYRHWTRGGKWLDPDLVAALWRADFETGYRRVVEHSCVHGVRAFEGDWCAVKALVDVALAQRLAGDMPGAALTTNEAHRVAEAGARETLESARGIPPEVAVWYLSDLIPLEVALGNEPSATAMLARCRPLKEAKATSSVDRSWRDTRATTEVCLRTACSDAGWADAAFEFGAGSHLLARALSNECDSRLLRRWAERLLDPRERLEFLLNVCRRLPQQV
jgi:hypothetical protein